MDNVYTYIVNLPPKFKEVVLPCADGYTVYIASWLDRSGRIKAFKHALTHIKHNDFNSTRDIQTIERCAHVEPGNS